MASACLTEHIHRILINKRFQLGNTVHFGKVKSNDMLTKIAFIGKNTKFDLEGGADHAST